jgi:nucleolar protein 53
LNSIVDPSQPGAGSALLEVSEAVKQSGQYNMWSPQAKAVLDDGLKVKVCASRFPHRSQTKKHSYVLQAPDVPNPRAAISLPAVPVPHAGTSYNPPEAAHTALLRAAHEAELRRVQEAEALEATKARFISARHTNGDNGNVGAQCMLIDKPGEGKEEDVAPTEQTQDGVEQYDSAGEDANAAAKKKSALQRKTKQQRRKAEKLRAEVRGSTPPLSPSPHV